MTEKTKDAKQLDGLNMGGPTFNAALPTGASGALGDDAYPPTVYDAESDMDSNGEPAHLSSQAGDPGAFERQREVEAKRKSGKR